MCPVQFTASLQHAKNVVFGYLGHNPSLHWCMHEECHSTGFLMIGLGPAGSNSLWLWCLKDTSHSFPFWKKRRKKKKKGQKEKKIFTGYPPILIGSILLLPQKYIKNMIKPDRYCFLWWPSHSQQPDNQIMKFMSGLWCCLLCPESFIIDFYRAL